MKARPWAIALFFFAFVALGAPPPGPKKYLEASPGLIDLAPGTIIEGSVEHGGLQPDYLIDLSNPALQRVLDHAEQVGQSHMEFWDKIESIQTFIRGMLPNRSYDGAAYLKLMEKYRRLGKPVPLGEYAAIRSGVCREYAMLTHFALKAAGIENFYGYYQVDQNGRVEDHAFTVVRYKNEAWVIDTYNNNFNGYRLEALLRGNRLGASKLEWEPSETRRRVLKLHNHPRYWVPEGADWTPPCKVLIKILRGEKRR